MGWTFKLRADAGACVVRRLPSTRDGRPSGWPVQGRAAFGGRFASLGQATRTNNSADIEESQATQLSWLVFVDGSLCCVCLTGVKPCEATPQALGLEARQPDAAHCGSRHGQER
jgi:hypothetical protein